MSGHDLAMVNPGLGRVPDQQRSIVFKSFLLRCPVCALHLEAPRTYIQACRRLCSKVLVLYFEHNVSPKQVPKVRDKAL